MANVDRAKGFVCISALHGGKPRVRAYRKEASVILGLGDPVVITGAGSAKGTNNAPRDGVPLVTRAAAASGTITGIAVGFKRDDDKDFVHHDKHMNASDTGTVYVIDDPDAIFVIQEDSDANNLLAADVGEGVDITIGNASTLTGYSICEIDSSTSAAETGNADQLRVLALHDAPLNDYGPHADWEVLINEHTYRAAQTMI